MYSTFTQIVEPIFKMADLISIKINIGDRTYPVKVMPEDEASLRQITKMINDKIVEYRSLYSGKDLQDYISMVLLWFVTERAKNIHQAVSGDSIQNELNKIDAVLNELLAVDKN